MDFGNAAHGDYLSITYDPLSNRRAFYDASQVMPPAMLESYVGKLPTPRTENFRYQLRSGMLGWFSLMVDPREWSGAQRAEARREFALYKSALRPLIRDADLYHVADRPDCGSRIGAQPPNEFCRPAFSCARASTCALLCHFPPN